MSKGNENTRRLRYIRVLEKFFYAIVNYLQKAEEPTKEAYIKKVANAKRSLERVEPLPLYKEDLVQLEKLTHKILHYADSETEIEEIKNDILSQTNQYEKSINRKKYKKEKHAKSKFEDH